MNTVSVRQALSGDLDSVAVLFDQYRQFYQQAPDIALATEFIRQRFGNRESVLFVAENKAQGIVGFCQLYPSFCSVIAAPIYVLYDLFVEPAARKSGAGRALMLAAHEHAAQNGYARLDLTTAKTNQVAQSLYESLGWVRDEVFFTYNKTVQGQ